MSKIHQLAHITCSHYYTYTPLSHSLCLLCIIIIFECNFNTPEAQTGPTKPRQKQQAQQRTLIFINGSAADVSFITD